MATTSELILSKDQSTAYGRIMDWAQGSEREISLGGLAGTGKTTLLSILLADLPHVRVLTPTGKAAHVLRKKGVRASTIHSAIYQCVGEEKKKGRRPKPLFEMAEDCSLSPGDLVAVDEASMVNEAMARDLRRLGIRILWIGDHGQLEPVGDDPQIMDSPDLRLEEVHRQALQSSITSLAHEVRTGACFPPGWSDPEVKIGHMHRLSQIVGVAIQQGYDQIIAGFNKQRHLLNALYREQQGRSSTIEAGERVICLRNNRSRGLFNGMQFGVLKVKDIDEEEMHLTLTDGSRRWDDVPAYKASFADKDPSGSPPGLDLFDYAYAITCHKSQGSEWSSVVVLDCFCKHWDMARWRYTAITRAKDRLLVAL